MNILLIEDSRFLRAAIERSLVRAGHEVTSIADGREALVAVRRSHPALILLDMMLPGLDGTCVLKELKQDASTSQIPVIVLTGLSQKNEARLRKAGAAAYIEKSSLALEKNPDALAQAVLLSSETPLMTTPKRMKLQIELVVHEGWCDDPTGRRLPCLPSLDNRPPERMELRLRMCKRRSCCLGLADETRRVEVGSARLCTSWVGWCGGLSPARAPAGN
jgi:CheY-like chemotaxis protein